MSERWKFTPHASDRASEMGLGRSDVLEVIKNHETTWASCRDGEKPTPPRRVYALGMVAVVCDEVSRMVITVLHHVQDTYHRAS